MEKLQPFSRERSEWEKVARQALRPAVTAEGAAYRLRSPCVLTKIRSRARNAIFASTCPG